MSQQTRTDFFILRLRVLNLYLGISMNNYAEKDYSSPLTNYELTFKNEPIAYIRLEADLDHFLCFCNIVGSNIAMLRLW